MWAVVSGNDLGRVEAVAARLPDEQMAVSADCHCRDHDDGDWMLRDGVHLVALKRIQDEGCVEARFDIGSVVNSTSLLVREVIPAACRPMCGKPLAFRSDPL